MKGKWFASWRLSDESNQLKEQTRSESSMKECSWLDMLGKRLLRGCLLGVHRGETSSKNKRLIPQSNFMARYQLLWQGNQYWWGCWKDVRWHTSYSRSPRREGINEKLQLPNHHYFLYNKIKIKIKEQGRVMNGTRDTLRPTLFPNDDVKCSHDPIFVISAETFLLWIELSSSSNGLSRRTQ